MREGAEHGCSQVLSADAGTGVNTEELGGMNIMVITADGELITPALTGTILEGVTRDSILTVASELGLRPVARTITAEIFDRVDSGDIVEAFACGTAAVLTPVAEFRSRGGQPRGGVGAGGADTPDPGGHPRPSVRPRGGHPRLAAPGLKRRPRWLSLPSRLNAG